jgi:hypothetical protein
MLTSNKSLATARRSRITAATLATAALVTASALATAPVQAMGSGNPYEDFQVGVSYTIYQPSFTNGLPQRQVRSNGCGSDLNTEHMITGDYAQYNAQSQRYQGRNFSLMQGDPICADGPFGADMGTFTINGVKWRLVSRCLKDGGRFCSKAQSRQFEKYGGRLSATMPKSGMANATDIRIYFSGMKAKTARKIAAGLTPVS